MSESPDVDRIAEALRVSMVLLVRRLRQEPAEGDLTLPETSAIARLDRGGPTSATELAKLEQISPQSMGATLRALEARGFVERGPDPQDGRRAVISATPAGLQALRNRRSAKTGLLSAALATFTPAELDQLHSAAPLIERLAQSI
jgi:DNA-binding MarR family transcriptional regulator